MTALDRQWRNRARRAQLNRYRARFRSFARGRHANMPDEQWEALLTWVKSLGTDGWRKYKRSLPIMPMPIPFERFWAEEMQFMNRKTIATLMYGSSIHKMIDESLSKGPRDAAKTKRGSAPLV